MCAVLAQRCWAWGFQLPAPRVTRGESSRPSRQRLLAELPIRAKMLCVPQVVPCLLQRPIGRAGEQVPGLVPQSCWQPLLFVLQNVEIVQIAASAALRCSDCRPNPSLAPPAQPRTRCTQARTPRRRSPEPGTQGSRRLPSGPQGPGSTASRGTPTPRATSWISGMPCTKCVSARPLPDSPQKGCTSCFRRCSNLR